MGDHEIFFKVVLHFFISWHMAFKAQFHNTGASYHNQFPLKNGWPWKCFNCTLSLLWPLWNSFQCQIALFLFMTFDIQSSYSQHRSTIPWTRYGSLTHRKRWYPSLFSSLKMTPFFVAKHWLFSWKRPLFRDKSETFQSKMTPLLCGKTLTFQPKWTPFFTVKDWTSKLTSFSLHSQRWVPKYPFFLGKCESWISSKNTLYSWILELGCML